MAIDYLIYYTPPNQTTQVPIEVSALSYARKENEIGQLDVALLPYYSPGYFLRDGQIELWRWVNGQPATLVGNTTWFIQRIRYARTSAGETVIEFTSYDALNLLARRVVAYDGENSYTKKSDTADNIMKALVRENMGSTAFDTTRNLSPYVSVQGNTSLGALVNFEASYRNLYECLRDLTDASWQAGIRIVFDMVRLGFNQHEFRTFQNYQGVDHTADTTSPVVVSIENGSLIEAELIADYADEATVVYARGARNTSTGNVETIIDVPRLGASPYNRREILVDVSDSADDPIIQAKGKIALHANRPRIFFNGLIKDTPGLAYGVNYNYGDLVTAEFMGYLIDCRLDTIRVSWNQQSGEQYEARLHGEFYA